MQVFKINENGFYTFETYLTEKPTEFEITTPVNTHKENTFYKPKWNDTVWVEGATEEEIRHWEEANKPILQQYNEMEVLKEEVIALEKENKLLKAQVEALSQTSDFHEELIVEMANKVYA